MNPRHSYDGPLGTGAPTGRETSPFCDSGRDRLLGDILDADRFVGVSDAASHIRHMIGRLAATGATTLIEGETGTGKDVVALLLHRNSRRAKAPLVPINCAAIPDTMIEGELFGYEKGAFSNALRSYPGKFGLADGGTLFLDEVGELSLPAQAKILRALETGEIFPLGSMRPRQCSVRIVAATNRDLATEVAAGRFRSDLYYRLAVIKIEIPTLRERRCDIEPLAHHLVRDLAEQMDCDIPVIEASALHSLESREWPGNVRELRNALEHAMVIGEDRARIRSADLPEPVRPLASSAFGMGSSAVQTTELLQTIRECGGSKADAARQLKISRTTLYRRLQRIGLDPAII